MFSGIVEEKGRIKNIIKTLQGCKLTVECKVVSKDAKIGNSISVNGVCLTIVEVKQRSITFDVMGETLRRTNLANISVENLVNLERSLRAGDRISGHFVTGHIDCCGRLGTRLKRPNDYALDIELPKEKMVYVAEKGSIAIDGVSLTIGEIRNNYIKIYLIPLTLKATNLESKKAGDLVNVEFDILGKYATNNAPQAKTKIDGDFLKEHGFV